MNTAFQYPPPVAPKVRQKPQSPIAPAAPATTTSANQASRDSNALRASVLDAALQLGLGTNSTVANWIFNNSVEEEDENPRSPVTPGLTNNDTAGSDESHHYPSTPPATILPPHKVGHTLDNGFITIPKEGTRFTDVHTARSNSGGVLPGAFPANLPPPAPKEKGKLRKKRDEYESDGGYMSEGGAKAKKKKEKEEMKRKKSKKQVDDSALGYDTDYVPENGLSKSKTKKSKKASNEAGYETDGYTSSTSKSKKSRFFGLRSKQSKQELPKEELPLQRLPSPVIKEPIVLPIASKFATSPPPPSGASIPSIGSGAAHTQTSPNPTFTSSLKPPTSSPSSFAVSSPSAILQNLAMSPTPTPASRWSVTPSEVPTEVPPPMEQPRQRESLASLDSGESHAGSSAGSHMNRMRRVSSSIGHGSSSIGHGASSIGHGSSSVGHGSPSMGHGSSSLGHGSSAGYDYSYVPQNQVRTASRPSTADSHGSRPSSRTSNRPYPAISYPLTHKPSLNHKTSFTGRYPSPGNNSPTVSSEAFGNVPSAEHTQTVLYPTGGPPSNMSSPMTPSYPPSAMANSSNRIPSRAPSPASRLAIPNQTYLTPGSPGGMAPSASSPAPSPRPRPMNPPTDGFGPRSQSVSPLPSPGLGQPHVQQNASQPRGRNLQVVTGGLAPPNKPVSRAASPMVLPSEDFVIPSPSFPPSQQVALPSPNVLAYYDIPPPSPPPSGPLPSVPPPGSFPRPRERERTLSNGSSSNGHGVSSPLARTARNTSGTKLAASPPEQGLYSQSIPTVHRGKESPFPSKPILPAGTIHSPNGSTGSGSQDYSKPAPVGSGLEATMRVPRYRELYALALPEDAEYQERRKAFERMGGDEVERFERELSKGRTSSEQSLNDDEMDEDEMQDVLARFKESRLSHDRDRSQQQALGRSQSIKALQRQPSNGSEEHRRLDSVEVAGLPEISDEDDDEPITVPTRRPKKDSAFDDSDSDSDRDSRWTESLYSRASFLDPEKSEEARDRFIKRIEEMYNESGRERDAVPPVPKVPAAYAADVSTSNATAKERSWFRF